MRHRSMTVLSIAAFALWLAPSSALAQHGHAGATPAANHPTPQSHGGSNGARAGHAPKTAGNPHSASASSTTPKFVSRIQSNPQLSSRLMPLLPSGMSLENAAQGFKNQGQFIAALHVSKNLGIPFDQLKADMTGSNPKSLGQAIEALKPGTDASKATKTAENEAEDDVKASNTHANGNASASNRNRRGDDTHHD
jgi:hypothetical protein